MPDREKYGQIRTWRLRRTRNGLLLHRPETEQQLDQQKHRMGVIMLLLYFHKTCMQLFAHVQFARLDHLYLRCVLATTCTGRFVIQPCCLEELTRQDWTQTTIHIDDRSFRGFCELPRSGGKDLEHSLSHPASANVYADRTFLFQSVSYYSQL